MTSFVYVEDSTEFIIKYYGQVQTKTVIEQVRLKTYTVCKYNTYVNGHFINHLITF